MARIEDFLTRQKPDTPKREIGIGGFTALARVKESYKLQSDVTITAVEDGSFINDHINLKPITLSISGDVSDIHIKGSEAVREYLSAQAEIGNVSSQYASSKTQSQLSKIATITNDAADAVRGIDNLIATGEQINNLFGNKDTSTKGLQEQFIDAMEALHFGKQAVSIDMPFRRFDNMVITMFSSETDNEGDSISFSIEATQIKFAELQYIESAAADPAPGLGGQLSDKADKGLQEGKKQTESFATQLIGAIL